MLGGGGMVGCGGWAVLQQPRKKTQGQNDVRATRLLLTICIRNGFSRPTPTIQQQEEWGKMGKGRGEGEAWGNTWRSIFHWVGS